MKLDIVTQNIINRIEAGEDVHLSDSLKNIVNAYLAEKIEIGDRVRVIKSGKTGIVVNKIKYDREYQDWVSPNGYTAIQVEIDGRRRSYSARSLQRIGGL